jgi:hypothetical protein
MTSSATRPAIRLHHDPKASIELVAAFQLGCEEEGVPVETAVAAGDVQSLARAAATESGLFIGAGIDAGDTIALHEQRLGDRPPLLLRFAATALDARSLAVAAGRLARGRPLPHVVVHNDGPKSPPTV